MVSREYVAGFFDGEGCIYQQPRKDGKPRLRVTISQNDRRPLDLICERYGGKVTLHRPGHWRWVVYTQVAEDFLRDVRGLVVIKQEQLEAALVARSHVRSYDRLRSAV